MNLYNYLYKVVDSDSIFHEGKELDKLYLERAELLKNKSDELIKEICQNDITKNFYSTIKDNTKGMPIIYSYGNVRFEHIYKRFTDTKTGRLNGSDPATLDILKNAAKYQYIAHWQDLKDEKLNEIDDVHKFIIQLYILYFMTSVNNNMTYNVYGYIRYSPICTRDIKRISDEILDELKNENYFVKTINGQFKQLRKEFKSNEYNKMERFTKEELLDIIQKFDHKPTANEIEEVVNNEVIEKDLPKNNIVSASTVRFYINKYELKDMVSMRSRRTKLQIKNFKN